MCLVTLKNGFTVTGESACASPANFKKDVGETYALRSAKQKIYSLLAYELRTGLSGRTPTFVVTDEVIPHPTMTDSDVKTYMGTKVVHACPMTRGSYNKFRGWETPQDENPEDEGYLVEYVNGGKPNLRNFKGYVSWSPKDVFDKSYKVVEFVAKPEETFLDRLHKEISELNERWEKLSLFISSPGFKDKIKDAGEQEDLFLQYRYMTDYRDVLLRRLARHQ